jgi:hypothetical protein
VEQRRSLDAYARGLRDWRSGLDTDAAIAAGRNEAELMIMLRRFMGAEGD